ncbi:hypothetical protein KKI24_12470 [bacterium]|nr:hypothetical protein [bacterium]
MNSPLSEKICIICNKTKPLVDFYKHPKLKLGRENQCRDCKKESVKQRRKLAAAMKGPADTPAVAEGFPVDFTFDKTQIKQVETLMAEEHKDSFSAAFRHIVASAIDTEKHFTPHAFSRATSVLDANLFQLIHIKSNLSQLYDGYLTGKAPGIGSQVEGLKELIDLCAKQILMITTLFRAEAFARSE